MPSMDHSRNYTLMKQKASKRIHPYVSRLGADSHKILYWIVC